MAKKDFKELYGRIENQYLKALDILKKKQEAFLDEVVSPEMSDEVKDVLEPLKNFYQSASYLMFMLRKGKPSLDEEYQNLKNQAEEMKENISDMREAVESGALSSDRLDDLITATKNTFDAMDNWEAFLCYINKPIKKSSRSKYITTPVYLKGQALIDKHIAVNEQILIDLENL